MKIFSCLLLFIPGVLFAQNKVGINTTSPEHPFQVNVDSAFTDILLDQSIPGFSQGFQLIEPVVEKGAQQITVGQTGRLSGIELNFISVTEVDEVLVEAFRGAGPGGTLMTSKSLLDVVNGVYFFEFPQPWPEVTTGEMINIVVSPGPGESLKWSRFINNVYPGGTAYHYNGTWTALAFDLYLKSFVEVEDTVEFDVLRVQNDRMVGINNYVLPRYDGNAGEVMSTNGSGTLTWSNPDMLNVGVLQDSDQDTKIEVEATPDDDIIRFTTDSMERMTILQNGKVGIGTDLPTSLLHVSNGAVLFNGPGGDLPAVPDDPPASGSGTRLMWYPDKAAFRVGRVFGTAWDRDSIGQYSFAGGFGNKAKGIFGFVGSGEGGNDALGTHSFVGNGRDNIASGDYAFIGSGNDHNASGAGSFVGGGAANSATGQYAVVTGGTGNIASGEYSFLGSGLNLFARSYGESAFGTYVTDYVPMSSTSFHEEDRLFVVGNGTSNSNRNDALTILKNGSLGIGTSSPEYRVHIEGSSTSSQHILSVKNNYSGNTNIRAIEAIATPANGSGIGGHFTGGSKGIEAIANATGYFGGTLTGVEGSVFGGSGGIRIGLHGKASGGVTNWAGYFGSGNVRVENDMYITGEIGLGVSPSNVKLKIAGNLTSTAHVLQVSVPYLGNSHIRAIDAASIPAPGFGYGGHFAGGAAGVIGLASSGNSIGTCVGIDGTATGTTGTRIGIRGNASGGTTNWAGFFGTGNVYITNELRIGSGAQSGATGYKVAIDGKMIVEEVRVQLSGNWPDYVFKEDYHLQSLSDVDKFIKDNGHLPGIPSAIHVEQSGQHLGEIQIKLLEKIEELTLHLIALQKQNDALMVRVNDLEKNAKSTD